MRLDWKMTRKWMTNWQFLVTIHLVSLETESLLLTDLISLQSSGNWQFTINGFIVRERQEHARVRQVIMLGQSSSFPKVICYSSARKIMLTAGCFPSLPAIIYIPAWMTRTKQWQATSQTIVICFWQWSGICLWRWYTVYIFNFNLQTT